jgi:hypothetical protein
MKPRSRENSAVMKGLAHTHHVIQYLRDTHHTRPYVVQVLCLSTLYNAQNVVALEYAHQHTLLYTDRL